ncbi:MAG TPA: hypothetical protein ENJ90_07080 [Devosia sp.]|nr:hypothetical protein [Devosia sp.]
MTTALAAVAVAALGASAAYSQMAPFGGEEDVSFASELWAAMENADLAGPNQIRAALSIGNDPHGMLLETFYTKVEVGGREGFISVKRNYGPPGTDPEDIYNDPDAFLGAITVMFQREEGYDEDNQNWFWVKYLPDGSLDKNPAGVALAGKVAKGMDVGCIACHSAAPGGDYLFTGSMPDAM